MDVNRKRGTPLRFCIKCSAHFDSRHVIKVRERAIHPQLLVLRRMRIWVWDRRLGVTIRRAS